MQKNCELRGIVKHDNNRYGFKTSFATVEEAQKYKEVYKKILQTDDYNVENYICMYDKKIGEKK